MFPVVQFGKCYKVRSSYKERRRRSSGRYYIDVERRKISTKVIANVKERMKQIQKSLPEGVAIDAFIDRTELVDRTIGTVEKNLLEGALIVIFVLVLFVRQPEEQVYWLHLLFL